MNLVISVALLAVFVAGYQCYYEGDPDYARACQFEKEATAAFNAEFLDDRRKDVLFESFLKHRTNRQARENVIKMATHSDKDLSDLEKDQQVLQQLCKGEKQMDLYARKNQDKLLQGHLDRKAVRAKWLREKFVTKLRQINPDAGESYFQCPVIVVDGSQFQAVAAVLKEYFYHQCREEAKNDYIKRKITQVVDYNNILLASTMYVRNATIAYQEAKTIREEFCEKSLRECCGEQLVEEARGEGTLKVAHHLIEMAEMSTKFNKEMKELERVSEKWDEKFKQLCELEHKIGAGRELYQARERTLDRLHERAMRDRTNLGSAIGRSNCPVEITGRQAGFTVTANKVPRKSKVEVDPKCEKEVKSVILCRAFDAAKQEDPMLNEYDFVEFKRIREHWCEISRKVQEEKDSVSKVYKSKCTEQMVAILTDDAKVESEVLLELLQLEKVSEKARIIKENALFHMRAEHEALRKLVKLYKKDLSEETDAFKKEKTRQAFELFKNKLEEVESNDGSLKTTKFALMHPSTWKKSN